MEAQIRPIETYDVPKISREAIETEISDLNTIWSGFIHAHKIPSIRTQCSNCGRMVGKSSCTCEGCGADLR